MEIIRLISFGIFISALGSIAFGQNATLTTKSRSNYLGANGAIFYDGPVQQTDLSLNWKNGVYADLWASTGFNLKRDFDKEVDFTLGKAGKLGKFNYSADVNYFMVVIPDVVNINAELSRNFSLKNFDLEPFARIEWYFPFNGQRPRRGIMAITGTRASVRLASRLQFLGMLRIKKDTGCFGFNSTLLGQGYYGLLVKLNEKFGLTPGANWSIPVFHVTDRRKNVTSFEIKFSYNF